jgi:hypothetical protein
VEPRWYQAPDPERFELLHGNPHILQILLIVEESGGAGLVWRMIAEHWTTSRAGGTNSAEWEKLVEWPGEVDSGGVPCQAITQGI